MKPYHLHAVPPWDVEPSVRDRVTVFVRGKTWVPLTMEFLTPEGRMAKDKLTVYGRFSIKARRMARPSYVEIRHENGRTVQFLSNVYEWNPAGRFKKGEAPLRCLAGCTRDQWFHWLTTGQSP